jgi:CRISPR/Cas system-associated exonuclease Cas4 (RecB family)
LVLSASSIKVWLQCGRRFYYDQVLRILGRPNMAMAVGTAVHAGVEATHKGLDATGATETAFAGEMTKMGGSVVDDPVVAFRDAEMMLALYRAKVAPTFKPTIVEREFVIRANGVLVSGQIDAADDDVRDTKTTANLSKFRPQKHRLQLNLYRLGYRAITGRWPGRLLLDVLARNGRYKQVEIEVDEGEVADVLMLVSSAIMRGDYEPTGALNGSCARCPYLEICPYAVTD